MGDPFIEAAQEILDLAVSDFREVISGATPEMLNRRPGGDGTNSITVLAVHAMHSTRSWLSVAAGAPRPARNRGDEFIATTPDDESLLAFVDSMHADCRRILTDARYINWSALRETHARPGGPGELPSHVSAAWALVHAMEHLREHVGHVGLTGQLLNRQRRSG
jgi:hypothetical protein